MKKFPFDCEACRREMIATCNRVLKVEREIKRMPRKPRQWFLNKPEHADAFLIARALRTILRRGTLAAPLSTEAGR